MSDVYCDKCGKRIATVSTHYYTCQRCGYKMCGPCHQYSCPRCGNTAHQCQ